MVTRQVVTGCESEDGVFPFKRCKVGTAVRYYNIDVYKYILTLPEDEQNKSQLPTENNSS